MVGVRADGLGASVGQPGRNDLLSEAHQEHLRAGARLAISSAGLDGAREDRRGSADRPGPADAYQAQARAHAESGAAWQSRRSTAWDRFAEGRGRARAQGTVVIDGQGSGVHAARALAPAVAAPAAPAAPRPDGWSRLAQAHQHAARFEEYAGGSPRTLLGQSARSGSPRRRGFVVE